MMTGFIDQPAALVSGPAAYLLSRMLRSPAIATYIRSARWLHGDDFTDTVRAIHRAGRCWESTTQLPQRDTDHAHVRCPSNPATMSIETTAGLLGLSVRRTQELASKGFISGRRFGRRWQLDPSSVHAYQHHHHQKRTA